MHHEKRTTMVLVLICMFTLAVCLPFGAATSGWSQTYGGPGDDEFYSMVRTSDGGFALAGYTNSSGAGDYDFWLVKTNSSGTMQWNQTYGGANADEAFSVVQTNDAGYALAGMTESYGVGHTNAWLVKTDSSGNMQWSQAYGGGADNGAYSVIQTSDGGYALAGFTDSFGAGKYDFWLIKTNSSGSMQWNQTYGGTGDEQASSVIQTSDGGFALAGYTDSFGAGSYDFWLVKTDFSGTMLWNRTYGGSGDDEAECVIQTSDGGYALAGYTNSTGAGGLDFWLVKTDSTGTLQWSQTYGGGGDDEAFSLIQTSDGGYALAGSTSSYGAGEYDGFLVKTDSAGNSVMPQSSAFPVPYTAIMIVVIILVIIIAGVVIVRRRRPKPDTSTVQQVPPPDSGMKPA
jgi:predicted secreted protein